MKMPRPSPTAPAVFAAASLTLAGVAAAQVDSLTVVVPRSVLQGNVTSPGEPATFGYDPSRDRIFFASFPAPGQDLRVIRNLSTTPVSTDADRYITQTPWNTWLGGTNPVPGSMLLNPQPIVTPSGTIPAYGAAFITQGGNPSPQRFYRYNLQPAGASANEELTSLVTVADMRNAVGATTGGLPNVQRQFAWSGDGQSAYVVDTQDPDTTGGLWRFSAATPGNPVRLYNGSIDSEPSRLTVNGTDRVYFEGLEAAEREAGDATPANGGGLDYYDVASDARQIAVAGQAVADFLEVPLTTTTTSSTGTVTVDTNIDTNATAVDAAGNVYFNNRDSSPADRRGIYRLDPQGRLSKVVSNRERVAALGSSLVQTFNMQPRTVTVNGVAVTQVMYLEQGNADLIAGAMAWEPGDFDRDGGVDAADLSLFRTRLTLPGVVVPLDDVRYDLNGNNEVTFRDVKVLQSFALFPNGDSNFDYTVNFPDLLALASNYNQSARLWTQGDFTGDGTVNFPDLLVLASNYNRTTLPPGADVADAAGAAFAADWARALASVPEPTTAAAGLAIASIGLLRRRWTV